MKNKIFLICGVLAIVACMGIVIVKINIAHKSIKDYHVYIYLNATGLGDNPILIYNDNDAELSKEISKKIQKARKTFDLDDKKYNKIPEGHYNVYLVNESEKLKYEVVDKTIFDLKRMCNLNYNVLPDIYEYIAHKYINQTVNATLDEIGTDELSSYTRELYNDSRYID